MKEPELSYGERSLLLGQASVDYLQNKITLEELCEIESKLAVDYAKMTLELYSPWFTIKRFFSTTHRG